MILFKWVISWLEIVWPLSFWREISCVSNLKSNFWFHLFLSYLNAHKRSLHVSLHPVWFVDFPTIQKKQYCELSGTKQKRYCLNWCSSNTVFKRFITCWCATHFRCTQYLYLIVEIGQFYFIIFKCSTCTPSLVSLCYSFSTAVPFVLCYIQ